MKPRIKTGQLPGQVGKDVKISMLEGSHPDKNRSKSFKAMIRMKERAVLKERARREIRRALTDE